MLPGLIFTAFLMGLGGVTHCAAMCGAACATAFPKGVPLPSLLGRCVGYALLGGVAAASAGAAAQWGRQFAFVQPLWILAQAGAVLLGVYLAWAGQVPHQVDAWGHDLYRRFQARWSGDGSVRTRPAGLNALWPFVAGMAWAVLPCGLLYAAVMVAALASSAWGGALVMLAFAVPGAFGVWAAPALIRRLLKPPASKLGNEPVRAVATATAQTTAVVPVIWMSTSGPARSCAPSSPTTSAADIPASWRDPRWAVRLAGLMLVVMGSWALYHQILAQWRAWCA